MTRAAEIRTTVLAYAEQGLAEEEIAREVGIPARRVLRLLDAVEAIPIYIEPPADRLTPIHLRKRPSSPQPRRSRALPAKEIPHGTEAGYQRHMRNDEKACEDCLRASAIASAERKERPGGVKDRRRILAAAKRYHRWATDSFGKQSEARSPNDVIRQTILTRYTYSR